MFIILFFIVCILLFFPCSLSFTVLSCFCYIPPSFFFWRVFHSFSYIFNDFFNYFSFLPEKISDCEKSDIFSVFRCNFSSFHIKLLFLWLPFNLNQLCFDYFRSHLMVIISIFNFDIESSIFCKIFLFIVSFPFYLLYLFCSYSSSKILIPYMVLIYFFILKVKKERSKKKTVQVQLKKEKLIGGKKYEVRNESLNSILNQPGLVVLHYGVQQHENPKMIWKLNLLFNLEKLVSYKKE